jgi:tetratricopeptide (TPR) repeat protein
VVDAPDGPRSAADEPTAQPDARTGRDLFDDWRTALSVLDQTDADYVADLAARRTAGRDETERSAVRADPLISAWLDRAVDPDDPKRQAEFEARRRRMRTIESSARWAARLLDAGVTSLAGSGGDPVNRLLEMGEKEMAARRYYDAARTFQRAASVDARHPLPYIACGHALLAAGDYVAACARLQQGYGLYGRAALLSLDLPALLGDPRVVELRIGDLRTQLQNNEDDQLRFLLGYAQYHSGARADGLLNLIHAARGAPPGSVISLYPDLLIDRGATPSP